MEKMIFCNVLDGNGDVINTSLVSVQVNADGTYTLPQNFVKVERGIGQIEVLKQENEQLKTEIEQHKSEANVTTQAIFELALEIESLKGGV